MTERQETTPSASAKLLADAQEITRMAESLQAHGLHAKAAAFALIAAERIHAAKAFQAMEDASRG